MTREEAIKIIESNCSCSGSKLREACAMFIPELTESEDERIRKEIIEYLWDISNQTSLVKESLDCRRWIAYLEKQKNERKEIEAIDRIDKYIDEHLANAHDMKDSNTDKKYYRELDDALGKIAGILQDVYSGEKQK